MPLSSKQEKDIIARALKRFELAQAAESKNREYAMDDLRFRIGEQWPEDIKRERENDGQACLTINKIPSFVRQIVNEMRQMRPAIKVRGVDSVSDPETAEIMNGLIRAIESDSSADSAYDYAGEYAVTCGFGYWRILTEYEHENTFDQVIKIVRIRDQFSAYLDPGATAQDKSDAKWGFVVESMSREDFKVAYPNAADIKSWDFTITSANHSWLGEDDIRVAEYWEVEEESKTLYQLFDGSVTTELPDGMSEDAEIIDPMSGMVLGPMVVNTRSTIERKVMQYILTAGEVLEVNEWPGKYIPIVEVTGEELIVDGDVERRGMVRDMQDPQRMYNYARSQSVDRISLAPKAPFVGAEGMFKDPNWSRANSANLAYLSYKPIPGEPPPQRQPAPDASSALIAEVQTTAQELKDVAGIYNAGLGDRSNEIAGVAIDSRKLESDVGTFHYLDNLAKAIRYTGKILVDLIPKIYSTPRAVRILALDGEDSEVQVNQPYMDRKTGKMHEYNLNAGRYDVSVDVGPSYTTQRQEAAASMLEVMKSFPEAARLIGDLVAKSMDWPEADEVSKRLKLLLPPEILAEEFPVIKQLQQQMQVQGQQAQQMIEALQQQIVALSQELQNRQQDNQIKLMDVQRKSVADENAHTEKMTDLEIKAAKDLGPAGVAYGT